MKSTHLFGILAILLLLASGCARTLLNRNVYRLSDDELNSPEAKTKILKVHMSDGSLYVLNDWLFNEEAEIIAGYGDYYNFNRRLLASNQEEEDSHAYEISYSEVSLIETNKIERDGRNLIGISIAGVSSAFYSIYCMANPKACFGSCPTFYALKDGNWQLISEGFSSSISSSFEKTDVDMLYGVDHPTDTFTLKVTNEALETHVIRYVDLLAFPLATGEQVFATEAGVFYRTSALQAPQSCLADEGDMRALVLAFDGKERYSLADEHTLTRKEEIILTFANPRGVESGLLIGSKQSLLTTFLFYELMAYSGTHYGRFVARVENGDPHLLKRIEEMWDRLGGIEVFVQMTDEKWLKVGEINEMGPIAADIHLVKLPATEQENITLKLRLTKGLWRIDYLSLTEILGEETPLRVKPLLVTSNDTICPEALQLLTDEQEPLVTFPGDHYTIHYPLPDDCSYQFFLETKGYYLEWMRDEWIKEEDLKKAALALYFPGLFMRKAAPAFKRAEPHMEKIFWESRYVKQ